MPMSSSAIIEDQSQGGPRHIMERHITHLGEVIERRYMVAAGVDPSVGLAERGADILASLIEAEVQTRVSAGLGVGGLRHATANNVRQGYRRAYREARGLETLRLASVLNTATDAQLAAVFQLPNPSLEITALRLKLSNQATKWSQHQSAIDGEAGE